MSSVVRSHSICLTKLHVASWRRWRPSLALLVLVGVGGLSGCGPKAPYDLTPVSGKITYSDGSLIEADQITVSFVPVDNPSEGPRPNGAMGVVNPRDGTFSLTTGRLDDGAAVGKHRVSVIAFKMRTLILRKHKITPAEVAVTDDGSMFIHLKVEKTSSGSAKPG